METTTTKRDIRKLKLDELKEFFVQHGEKPFRAQQVYIFNGQEKRKWHEFIPLENRRARASLHR